MGSTSFPWPAPRMREHCYALGLRSAAISLDSIEIRRRDWKNSPIIARGGRKSSSREAVTSGRPLSKEGIAVVQALKAARDDRPQELDRVFAAQVSRLLKRDLVDVFKELERQNECDLALRIFEVIRGEEWFKPDFRLYRRLFSLMWDNNRVEDMVYVYDQVKRDGLEPDMFLLRELMIAQLKHGNPMAAMELYQQAKPLNFRFNEKTFLIVIREFQNCGRMELAEMVQKDLVKEFQSMKNNI